MGRDPAYTLYMLCIAHHVPSHHTTPHSYYLYSILQDSIDNVTVPAWVTTTL